jgi:hypothetical protein
MTNQHSPLPSKKLFTSMNDESKPSIRLSTIVIALFAIYLIGAHLRLSIYSDNSILVPMYLMIASGTLVFLLSIKSLLQAVLFPLIAITIFTLAQPFLSYAFGARQEISATSSIQLLVSIIISLSFVRALSIVDRVVLWRMLFVFWAVLIALAFLENFGFRGFFDDIRAVLYGGSDRGIYASDLRDISLYGSVRSTVFASEPSFLADSLCSLVVLMFMLDPKRGMLPSWIRFGAMLFICILASPSFKVAFYIVALLLWQYWPRNPRSQLFLALFLPIFALFLWQIFPSLLPILEGMLGQHSETGSFYGRVEVGPSVAANALLNSPLFGYGLGGADEVYPIISSIWDESGAFQKFSWYVDLGARELMSNGFWWQWIFLGVVGGVIFIFLLLRLMDRIGVTNPIRALVCTWIVWYAGSAFVDPQSWYMLIIFSLGSMRTASPESNISRVPT